MSYYQEHRAIMAAMKQRAKENQSKRERKFELRAVEATSDLNIFAIRVDGMSCKLIKSDEMHRRTEQGESLIPWLADSQVTLDKYDCRNLLDFYREPDSRVIQAAKANVDADAEEELAFESYRDLVRLLQQKVSDEEGIEQAEKVNVDMRFRVQSLAAKAHGLTLPGMGPGSASQGQFSAVPMDYGRGGDDVDDADAAPVQVGAEDEATAALEEEGMEHVALDMFGVDNFVDRLQQAEEAEEKELGSMFVVRRTRWSNKQWKNRNARMKGQGGLQPPTRASAPDARGGARQPPRRGSPTHGRGGIDDIPVRAEEPRSAPAPDAAQLMDPEMRRRAGIIAEAADPDEERRRRERAVDRLKRAEQLRRDMAKPAEKPESARERLQRLMKAQLSKQEAEDAAKKMQKESLAAQEMDARNRLSRSMGAERPQERAQESRGGAVPVRRGPPSGSGPDSTFVDAHGHVFGADRGAGSGRHAQPGGPTQRRPRSRSRSRSRSPSRTRPRSPSPHRGSRYDRGGREGPDTGGSRGGGYERPRRDWSIEGRGGSRERWERVDFRDRDGGRERERDREGRSRGR